MSDVARATLTIDVGGTGIKSLVLDEAGEPISERIRVRTPRPATPQTVMAAIMAVIKSQPAFERISVGFPGVVIDNVVYTAHNLDGEWVGYPLGRELEVATERMVRVANDADVQGLGVVEGRGVEMVLTLGTGLGSALFVDGHLVPNLELGHHPLTKKRTYEEYVGKAALKATGTKVWNKRVRRVLDQIQPIWNPRKIYVGGGNAKKLTGTLPDNVELIPNVAGLLGGIRLWRESP